MLDNWPVPNSDDSYNLSDIQTKVWGGKPPPVTKVTAGQTLPDITQKLQNVAMGFSDGTMAPLRVGHVELIRSNKWFTLVNSSINDQGELVYQVEAVGGKKTADGKVVRIRINHERGPGAFLNADTLYQIG